MIPIILLGGILTGWFTPTEAGVVAVCWIMFVIIPMLNPRHIAKLPRDFCNAGLIYSLPLITIAAATEHTTPPPDDQIPITRNEIAALFSTLIIDPVKNARHRLRWSAWRRRHQHRAKTCHYQRQARQP